MTTYICFPIGQSLAERMIQTHTVVKQQPPAKQHIPLMTEVALEITDANLNFFFLDIGRNMGATGMVTTILEMGTKMIKGGVHMIVTKVIKGLSEQQLGMCADFFDEMLLQENEGYFIGYPVSEAFSDELERVFDLVCHSPSKTDHAQAFIDLNLKLTDISLDFYFIDLAERLEIKGWGFKTVQMGINLAKKGAKSMITKTIGGMNDEQLLQLAEYLSQTKREKL